MKTLTEFIVKKHQNVKNQTKVITVLLKYVGNKLVANEADYDDSFLSWISQEELR